jgi:hypothetical protein
VLFDLDYFALAVILKCETGALRIPIHLCGNLLPIYGEFALFGREAKYLDMHLFPPRGIGSLVRTDVKTYPLGSSLTTEIHPKIDSTLKSIGFSIILIEFARAPVSKIYTET